MAKDIKKISSKRKKVDADHEMLGRLEFLGSLYLNDTGPIIPAENIEAAIVEGAKKVRRGPDAKAGLFVLEHAQLEYNGPRNPDELWEDKSFRCRAGVKVQKSRVIRTRPIFRQWSVGVQIQYEDTVLNGSDVHEFLQKAGQLVGLGDWRPRYGRFNIQS
jgi:hypothetical protein